MLDHFDSGIITLAIAIMILSIMDSMFTLTIISNGGTEVNPIMNAFLHHSVWAFTAFKMLCTGIPAIILVALGNLRILGRYRVRSILATFVGLYAGLIVYELGILYTIATVA